MELTNKGLIRFCQNMLGAPYWLNTTCVKATKNAYNVNSIRFPEEYEKHPYSYYEQHIKDNEVVTDSIGLIKGFAWTDGGEEIILRRGTECSLIPYKVNSNGCPDKSVNGLFSWATTQNIKWGSIDTLPEVPGLVVTCNGRLAIYEGNGYIIEANREKGKIVHEPIDLLLWDFWYELPFVTYDDEIIVQSEEDKEEFVLQLNGVAIAINNVLYREETNEDSKFLGVIEKNTQVEVYNDSTAKWLHVVVDGKEGYALAELFMYYPEKPNLISAEMPLEVNSQLQGDYMLLNNASIRNKAHVRGTAYTTIPKHSIVTCTGGITNNWLHVYAKHNNKSYVGYIDQKFLQKA